MYIDLIQIKNIGPIDKFFIKNKFEENGNPYPIVIIGDNGKGKTILSSYVGDSFIEIAKKYNTYTNIVNTEGAFYKLVGGINVKNGKSYGSTIIMFKDEKQFSYIEKTGDVNIEELKSDFTKDIDVIEIEKNLSNKDFSKGITDNIKKEDIEKIFDNNVLCFFPSYRSEKPIWMNEEAIKYNEIYEKSQRFNGILNKEIIVEHSEERNTQWVQSVIVDSLIDIIDNGNNSYTIQGNVIEQQKLKKAKNNLETILKLILKVDNVKLNMNYRNQNNNFRIECQKNINKTGSVTTSKGSVISSLKHLSLGQAVLFNMFATIIRHADINSIYNSINLSEITGIVAIDEVDMHLDSEMQYEVLPKLIKLFPKIQFIITTHSPLFLLGMDKELKDKYTLIEMPDGNEISTERFSEFEKSYVYLNNTKKYEEDINMKVKEELEKIKINNNIKPLVITEGKTDWKHLKRALEKFKNEGRYKNLDFDFLEYTYDLGESELVILKESLVKLPNKEKIILIADRDTNTKEIIDFELNGEYREWGSKVYSFRIPVPQHRTETPDISIEHYYFNDELKKEVEIDGIKRRLFMANEFNEDTGDFKGEENYRTNRKKPKNIIEIYDGSSKCKVTKFKEEAQINYALSKDDFFEKVVNKEDNNIGYENFSLIFDKIEKIINEQ